MTHQLQVLKTKSDEWAKRIQISSLPRSLVWQAYHSTLLNRLGYALLATTLTRNECDSISTNALRVCLSKSSLVRTMAKPIVHGPLSLQGLAIPHLEDMQGMAHVCKILKYAANPGSPNHHLLMTALEDQQLELGIPTDPLQLTPRHLSYLTPTWLTHTSEYMNKVGWTID
jgi:hypothetical protein